ncbi:probable Brh2-interacting protein Dss1 [Melanopsichium pennsylvanicum]|uniref:26S proteasome complex subunit SEM1 n=2 Tax=Melanopsichium pennsylvanicum TaxID=63383 RepID=A0AAJ5C7H0_9BASI|nr:Brh2-interacting protein Dss1 [Melanopsichium pennsylvanicum 4]SNX86897.1 probable Brh2-interacting protein Dss1 [Melanopsichium pennsylvanicum]
MSATNSQTTKPDPHLTKPAHEQKSSLPSLGALDEDDEFEEFDEQDWNDTETDLSNLQPGGSNAPGAGVGLTMGASSASTGDHLWQDSWDDDTVEDDFSKALRAELDKQSNAPQAMST